MAVLYEHWKLPSFFWCGDAALASRDELVRVRMTPHAEQAPLKVRAVCLPYVLVNPPRAPQRPLDVRRVALARLDTQFARLARRAPKNRGKADKRDAGA